MTSYIYNNLRYFVCDSPDCDTVVKRLDIEHGKVERMRTDGSHHFCSVMCLEAHAKEMDY